jgi:DNA-binding NarL/FixJ family response regulator
VVLLDLDLGDGIRAPLKISTLRRAGVATVIISTLADLAHIRICLAAGAAGYLPKTEPADEILRAVTAAAAGESYMTSSLAALLAADREDNAENAPTLSTQELRALILCASGLPMKSVARRLGVSIHTAKGYIDRVREKYTQASCETRTKLDLHCRAVEEGRSLQSESVLSVQSPDECCAFHWRLIQTIGTLRVAVCGACRFVSLWIRSPPPPVLDDAWPRPLWQPA